MRDFKNMAGYGYSFEMKGIRRNRGYEFRKEKNMLYYNDF